MPHPLDGLRLNTEATGRMTIINPVTKAPVLDKDKAEAYIELLSFDSAAARAHDRKTQDTNLKAARASTREENESRFIEKLVAVTKSWHLVSLSGEVMDVPCTAAMAEAVYSDDALMWLKTQVIQHCVDLGNFPGAVPNG